MYGLLKVNVISEFVGNSIYFLLKNKSTFCTLVIIHILFYSTTLSAMLRAAMGKIEPMQFTTWGWKQSGKMEL